MTLISPTILPPALVNGTERASQLVHHYAPVPSDPQLAPISRGTLALPTAIRSTAAWGIGSDGRSYRMPDHLARYEWWDLDGDGVREVPALVCEDASTNLCGYDDDLASWTTSGTISRTLFATCGDSDVYLVTDSDATNRAYLARTIAASAFVGATTKGIRVIWGKGPSPAASGAFVWLRDTSGAPADRLLASPATGVVEVRPPGGRRGRGWPRRTSPAPSPARRATPAAPSAWPCSFHGWVTRYFGVFYLALTPPRLPLRWLRLRLLPREPPLLALAATARATTPVETRVATSLARSQTSMQPTRSMSFAVAAVATSGRPGASAG